MSDEYRFLDPWTLLLPERGPCVLAVAGSGGKTTLVRRLLTHYRAAGKTVVVTQTVDHPAPIDLSRHDPGEPGLGAAVRRTGAIHLGASPGPDGSVPGIAPDALAELTRASGADVVLVEAHSRTQTPLRRDAIAPVWPLACDRAFLVTQLGAVGRPISAATVAGPPAPERGAGEEPPRIRTDDVVDAYLGPAGLFSTLPATGLPIPFLTGFGAFRDMDGMFALVSSLWQHPRVRAVCLAELLGDERRDAADRRDLPAGAPDPTQTERVYALYPADLDDH